MQYSNKEINDAIQIWGQGDCTDEAYEFLKTFPHDNMSAVEVAFEVILADMTTVTFQNIARSS